MRVLVFILVFCLLPALSKASGPYRDYLLSKIYIHPSSKIFYSAPATPLAVAAAFIPHYQTPRGAIFCRMEDKVTKATKVWLKIGVQ